MGFPRAGTVSQGKVKFQGVKDPRASEERGQQAEALPTSHDVHQKTHIRPRLQLSGNGDQAVAWVLRDWKHSRQNTGRPCVGRKGTVVCLPHPEHVAWVSTLVKR